MIVRTREEIIGHIRSTFAGCGLLGTSIHPQTNLQDLTERAQAFLTGLGLSGDHPSTRGTAKRFAKMYANEICSGLDWDNFPQITLFPNDANHNEIILIRNIKVHSLCEHHFVPIIGVAHIAYIPSTHILGLSKFNRITDFFCRQPQIQERLGEQISTALRCILSTDDVATIIVADHYCVKFRGVQDPCSDTVTSVMSGRFMTESNARQELMSLISL